jgi:hypothetical protein
MTWSCTSVRRIIKNSARMTFNHRVPGSSPGALPPNRGFPGRVKMGRFCGDFRHYRSALSVSGEICGLSGRFEPPVSASKNSVPRGRAATTQYPWLARESWELLEPQRTFRTRYRGFNPRASNCWLHSAGASRSRSTPMPRGNRPSTAARTRSGARNESEIVMLTWRTLHFDVSRSAERRSRSPTRSLQASGGPGRLR